VEVGTHEELMAKSRSVLGAVRHPGRVPLTTWWLGAGRLKPTDWNKRMFSLWAIASSKMVLTSGRNRPQR
jgi:hypothetical protein